MAEIPLTQKKCEPCEGKTNPFSLQKAQGYLKQTPHWNIDQTGTIISREYVAKNFIEAINFISKVAVVAEAESHHPDIHLVSYRKLRIDLSTHAIGGLSENDFIVAAKINELPIKLKG